MLSIYRDSSGKTVVDVTDCESVKEVKTVKMTNLGLTDFDQQMFSQMKNIEEMDISDNKLDTIPEYISLPKLKRLNCSRNRFTDITFVRQFPNLEEMDIRQNKISFSDHCIACDLCPRLKKVNSQDFNIDQLKEKLENRLKPLISRVWLDHFMSTFDDTMTMEEFDAIGEKFRTMLKHSNINVTKVVMKFKDFKLMQLIDRFLAAIRESSAGALFGISNCTTERSQKSYAAKKATQPQAANDIEFVPVTLQSSSGETSAASAEACEPETQDSPTVYVLTGDKEGFTMDSDTVYILTDDCEGADLSNVLFLTDNGQVTENGKKELRAIVDTDGTVLQNVTSETAAVPPEPEDGATQQVEGRVTKFLPGPISWGSPPRESRSSPVPPPEAVADEPQKTLPATTASPPVAKKKVVKPVVEASGGTPKVVKYWLYDEEIKPLRKAKKPEAKKKSKRPDLSQYIVGPASEFSLASRRATLAAVETSTTSLPETAAVECATASLPETAEEADESLSVGVLAGENVNPEVREEILLLDLWGETPQDAEVVEDAVVAEVVENVVVPEETNQVSEASLLLDLSQSRPASHVEEAMEDAPKTPAGDSSSVEEDSTADSEKVGRVRDDPDKSEIRVPPKKRVRFLDEVQTETVEEGACVTPELDGLSRPRIAEET